MSSSRKISPLFAALLLCLGLAAELVSLRCLFRFVLDIHIGWTWITDADIALAGFSAAWVYLYCLLRDRSGLQPAFSKKTAVVHLLAVAMLVLYVFALRDFIQGSALGRLGFFLLLAFTSASYLGSMLGWLYFARHPRRRLIWPCLLCAFSIGIAQNLPDRVWSLWVHTVGPLSCNLLTRVSSQVLECGAAEQSIVASSGLALRIVLPKVALDIGKACSGLEGIFVLSSLFLFWLPYSKAQWSTTRWVSFLVAGVLWALFVNCIRLAVLIGISIWLFNVMGPIEAYYWTMVFAHSHIGWLLYLVGNFLFFFLIERVFREGPGMPRSKTPALASS